MSTGIELIPVALAVGAVVARRRRRRGARQHDERSSTAAEADHLLELETRFRDGALLTRALREVGVEPVLRDGYLHGVVDDVAIALAPDEHGVYTAFFHGAQDAEAAESVVIALDATYTLLVQQDVHDRVLARAAEHGMTVEHDAVEPDGSRTLRLRVRA